MLTLPHKLPAAYSASSGSGGVIVVPDIDTGGYDVLIGGYGFRLATDQQNPFTRGSEPTTVHRFDSSLEPGEQTLSQIPWIKAQSSFHAGAGQTNLEQGFTAFQYEQEQVEHIRFDMCQGVNVWTPDVVSRLPDTHLYSFGFSALCMTAATVGGIDYAIVGGTHSLQQVAWNSGVDTTPTTTAIDLSGAIFGGASNCTVQSITTDGQFYYALIKLTSNGSLGAFQGLVVRGTINSVSAPDTIYKIVTLTTGAVGWAKARLIACLDPSFYELAANATPTQALPTAKYTSPSSMWTYSAISESPDGVLVAGSAGGQSSILEMTLDTSGATPTLSGGTTVAVLPPGEIVYSMVSYLASFLGVGTSRGVRVGTFDTYTGAFKMGPASVTTTAPVFGLTGRDRFIYAGYTNQQADGTTGLVCVDLSMVTDTAGRNAWAPDIKPPSTAPTGKGTVSAVGILPKSDRLIWLSTDGIHVEGNGPGSDGDAWLRTSRIRYDTAEMKLFKLGRIHGSLASAEIQVFGLAPYRTKQNLGTFGFLTDVDPGEFRLVSGLNEWIQLEFHLIGSTATLNSYQAKALPAPQRQHIITLTVNCFVKETDRYGLSVTDPQTPRQRFKNLQDLESIGDEIRFVEFTNTGPEAQLVVIDQMEAVQTSRPSIQDDFGCTVTVKLRTTEG